MWNEQSSLNMSNAMKEQKERVVQMTDTKPGILKQHMGYKYQRLSDSQLRIFCPFGKILLF